jgi:hypothetical protein
LKQWSQVQVTSPSFAKPVEITVASPAVQTITTQDSNADELEYLLDQLDEVKQHGGKHDTSLLSTKSLDELSASIDSDLIQIDNLAF